MKMQPNRNYTSDDVVMTPIELAEKLVKHFNPQGKGLEPCCGTYNSSWCKDDMVARKVPCIIVVPKEVYKDSWDDSFDIWVGADGIKKYYFGDEVETD